ATTDLQYFLFGGERLFPALLPEHLLWALGAIAAATVLPTLIPAVIASRVEPVAAMQAVD
ncbi:MAG: ABC-type lipoprotein release transport system permease subunit, partial [Myxococcota bacterium]